MSKKKITPEIVKQAWTLRRIGAYTMREIAEKLSVNREELIDAMESQAKAAEAPNG